MLHAKVLRRLDQYLATLVLAVILPAAVFGGVASWWITGEIRRDVEAEAGRVAEAIATDVAEHVAMVATAMGVLAHSPAVTTGDVEAAHRFALALSADLEQHIGLANPAGRQIFNTRRPLGSALPDRADARSYRHALATGRPSVSNVIVGAIAQRPLVTIDVPTMGPDGPLVLGTSTDVARIAAIVARTRLAEGWTSALLDADGRFIAHSARQAALAGETAPSALAAAARPGPQAGMTSSPTEDGTRQTTFFHKVPGTGWTALVSAPAPAFAWVGRHHALLLGGALTALGLTALIGLRMGRCLRGEAAALTGAALALARREPVEIGSIQLREFAVVGEALRQAGAALAEGEASLRESEARLRLFTEIVPAGIAMFDRDMRYLAVSERFAEDYKVPAARLIGRSHYEVFPEGAERWREVHRRCLDGGSECCGQDLVVHSDGTRDWIAWEVRPWYRDDGGVGGFVLASEVITHRKRAEDALRESEQRYRGLVESQVDLVTRLDPEGRYIFVNETVCRVLGRPREALLGRSWTEFAHPDDMPAIAEQSRQAIPAPDRRFCVTCRLLTDAGPRWFAWEGVAIFDDDGAVTEYQAVGRDVTEQRAAEAELKAAKAEAEAATLAKSRFLAAASHDLRQPFQAMRLFYEVLSTRLDEHQKAVAAKLDEAMVGGEQLLNALMDVSTLDAGTLKVNLAAFPLDDVILQVAAECEPQARAAGLRLRWVPTAARVRSDRVLLIRMVRNLVLNAIRYTRTGTVLVGCRPVGAARRIEVWDTGVGIPQDQLQLIFQDFYQVPDPAGDRGKGLGLGLSVVARTGRLLGHEVAVRSTVGRGSCFSITVPRADAPARAAAPPSSAAR